MSTTTIIIIAVAAAIVLLALLVLGGKKRRTKKQRVEAAEHRSEAQIRRQRAERELAEAKEQDELARRTDPDVDVGSRPTRESDGASGQRGADVSLMGWIKHRLRSIEDRGRLRRATLPWAELEAEAARQGCSPADIFFDRAGRQSGTVPNDTDRYMRPASRLQRHKRAKAQRQAALAGGVAPASATSRARNRAHANERTTVEIPKDKILDLLHEQGKSDQADQARQELPDRVDPERDSGLLAKFGIDP